VERREAPLESRETDNMTKLIERPDFISRQIPTEATSRYETSGMGGAQDIRDEAATVDRNEVTG
jgi:hypothetical protein